MEAERPMEEGGGEQGPQPDGLGEQGWPPVNSTTRPWRSAPPSPPPGARHTVLGPLSASLLSLQTELLLDLVAEAQSRRLEEQRAAFHSLQDPKNLAPALPRPLEEKEQLYTTILSHQCQRMEAQRSEPPLPPGGQELLELLLRVQGWGPNGGAKIQTPDTHLLRPESTGTSPSFLGLSAGPPTACLNPARQGSQGWKTQKLWQYSPPSASSRAQTREQSKDSHFTPSPRVLELRL